MGWLIAIGIVFGVVLLGVLAYIWIEVSTCRDVSGLPIRWRYWSKASQNELKDFWIERVRHGLPPWIALDRWHEDVGAFYLRHLNESNVDEFFEAWSGGFGLDIDVVPDEAIDGDVHS